MKAMAGLDIFLLPATLIILTLFREHRQFIKGHGFQVAQLRDVLAIPILRLGYILSLREKDALLQGETPRYVLVTTALNEP
jgi:hypothetical protein